MDFHQLLAGMTKGARECSCFLLSANVLICWPFNHNLFHPYEFLFLGTDYIVYFQLSSYFVSSSGLADQVPSWYRFGPDNTISCSCWRYTLPWGRNPATVREWLVMTPLFSRVLPLMLVPLHCLLLIGHRLRRHLGFPSPSCRTCWGVWYAWRGPVKITV